MGSTMARTIFPPAVVLVMFVAGCTERGNTVLDDREEIERYRSSPEEVERRMAEAMQMTAEANQGPPDKTPPGGAGESS